MTNTKHTARKMYEMTRDAANYLFPVENEPPILTMDKPLIIESACPGWQTGGKRFPAIPITIKDQIKAQVDSVKAGAILVHVHPKDPKTGNTVMNHKLLAQIYDGIFDKVGDFISVTHSWYPIPNGDFDFVTGSQELLDLGQGNKYIQASLVVPIGYRNHPHNANVSAKATIEGIKWFEKRHIKPFYQVLDTYSHLAFKRFLFDKKASTWKPFILNVQIGKHEAHAINRDPWSYLQLIANMNIVKENIPECVFGVYPGGRNWLPMITMGILLGADIVRVGIEDCYWLYPHKNDLIRKNSDVVKMAVELANLHGRRVVTDATEARKLLGMKLT